MSQMTRSFSTGGVLLALCATFAGCSSRTNVSATGGTPSQYTHLYITAQAVWFNTNANAGPDDSGWAKFVLKTPVTVDLVTDSNGSLGEIANDLRLAPGTYNSILLLPYISATPAASATALGATYNQEADYVDTGSTSHTVSLVIPNPEKGIVVPGASLTVPVGKAGVPSASSTTSSTNTTNTTPATTTTSTGNNTTTTVSFATSFDLNRDLHLFNWNTANSSDIGVLISPGSGVSTDLASTGGISGTLTLTSLTNIDSVSGRVAIQACAETPSSDGSHYQVVLCAPVQTDGTFTIYPLQSNSSTATNYEVVIHGPNISTIIIHSVPATTTSPSLTDATTTGSVATTTASSPVSIGTFIPTAAASYPVSVSASSSGGIPAGAAVTFYQTLGGSGEEPYAIDEVGLDPINLNLQTNESLSAGAVQSGTYSSSGSAITVTSQTPSEGAGSYRAAAVAPLYTDGIATSSTPVPAPSGTTGVNPTSTTTPVPITIPGLSLGSGSITASVTAATPGTYNGGQLLASHNGVVIGAAAISSSILSGGGSVTVSGLPTSQQYYLSAIVWSTTQGTFNYESLSSSPVSVSGSSATSTSVTIN